MVISIIKSLAVNPVYNFSEFLTQIIVLLILESQQNKNSIIIAKNRFLIINELDKEVPIHLSSISSYNAESEEENYVELATL